MLQRDLIDCLAHATMRKPGTAVYIGSGRSLRGVLHLAQHIDCTRYILSDYTIPYHACHQVASKTIEQTNKNGYAVAAEQKPTFVLIDQDPLKEMEAFADMCTHLSLGTYLFLDDRNGNFRMTYNASNRTGLERHHNLYMKSTNATRKDWDIQIGIASALRTIGGYKGVRDGSPTNAHLELIDWSPDGTQLDVAAECRNIAALSDSLYVEERTKLLALLDVTIASLADDELGMTIKVNFQELYRTLQQ